MKGIIFTQFLEMVEDKWGLSMLDELITKAKDPIDGAYNSVDTYDHKQLVNLVVELSKKTDIPVADLLEVYGKYLFSKLAEENPKLMKGIHSTFDMLLNIQTAIHTEVLKLHTDANPPRFESKIVSENEMELTYHSHRSMADVAIGLIKGCAAYYKETIEIETLEIAENGQRVDFKITRK
tara:strand:+ start:4532 stop:5071 length:540 start_codon:yes stop_codon:yes gene_type:complete